MFSVQGQPEVCEAVPASAREIPGPAAVYEHPGGAS